jgi:hypothetical protein
VQASLGVSRAVLKQQFEGLATLKIYPARMTLKTADVICNMAGRLSIKEKYEI